MAADSRESSGDKAQTPGLQAENTTPEVLALPSRWARALVQAASSGLRGKLPTAEVLCLDPCFLCNTARQVSVPRHALRQASWERHTRPWELGTLGRPRERDARTSTWKGHSCSHRKKAGDSVNEGTRAGAGGVCLEKAEEVVIKEASGPEAHRGAVARLTSGQGFGPGSSIVRVGLLAPPAKSGRPLETCSPMELTLSPQLAPGLTRTMRQPRFRQSSQRTSNAYCLTTSVGPLSLVCASSTCSRLLLDCGDFKK